MQTKTFLLNEDPKESNWRSHKFPWYWAPVFCSIWFVLFYVVVVPSFYSYPEKLLIRDEEKHPDEFIGERAEIQLLGLSTIGAKLTGSVLNEEVAKDFLLNEIEKIRSAARLDLYDIDVSLQYSSGQFMLWGMAMEYRNVTNIIVKIAPKNSKSQSYLLVNSHYDSEVGSPAAADAGVMIVVMLETLRTISISEKPLRNPIVFLLNGAEEANLLAAHGFITQHDWAKNCKALINLDSAGAGGREILFQTGPNHPWLMKYYKQSALHPYASTIAEEMFQNDFIPSDTDFRIFRDYGHLPGLDMAYSLNGYIYHTKYDSFSNLERGTYQTTGDNVLAITWALANADELENPEEFAEGHTIYFDFLGWFIIYYDESTGVAINITLSILSLVVIAISLYGMVPNVTTKNPKEILFLFGMILVAQVLIVAAVLGVNLLIGVIIDAIGLSQAWYSGEWIIFGLYMCPAFFIITMFQALFMETTKEKNPIGLDNTIFCFMHAHCIILSIICLTMTCLGVRSAFFIMVAIFFYTITLGLITVVKFFIENSNISLGIHMLGQLLPFWFYSYLTFAFLKTFVPMQGRDGPDSKPEILISSFSALMILLFGGFLLPLLHKFRKSKTLFSIFAALFFVFLIIAATPAGFPYEKSLARQRFYVLHTERLIYDRNGDTMKNESGYYIQPVDTHPFSLDDSTFKDAKPPTWIQKECQEETFCGLPLYNTRWMTWKDSAHWIPAPRPYIPTPTELTLFYREDLSSTKQRLWFSVKSVDRIVIYIDPLPGSYVADWYFDRTPLEDNFDTPYFVYYVYSMIKEPLNFWIDIERNFTFYKGPTMRLGIGAHFQYHTEFYTEDFQEFLASFPDWTYPTNWIATHSSWYF